MTGAKPKVLVLGTIEHAHDALNELGEISELITPKAKDRSAFLQEAREGAFDGVLAVYRTFDSVAITGRVDQELIDALPESLEFISHNGAGYDQVDVPACTGRNIRVSNTPTAVDDATADINMFLILGVLRNLNTSMLALRAGKWRGTQPPPLGHDPQGKILGILGMGGIGRNLKAKAEAFGMKVQYHNRKRLDDQFSGGAKYVGFEELLQTSDVLSCNLPLNPSTRHIISTPQFDLMKSGAVLVNTARGAVINEEAMVAALDSGKLRSVGLDVYENEPSIHPGLLSNPNVLLVPHMGTWTVETQNAMEQWTISNVRMAVEEGKLRSPVGEQADM
ncbi:MAG: hypothetical protein M1814_003015 [Vezdaea aestivalis]|nr:MAG: hypothetical protein M1814_003015 [Vezdaea aestivalis]